MTSLTKQQKKRYALVASILSIIAIAWYWHHSTVYPSTDNAYVQANIVNVAPQVNGQVDHIYIQNHQWVKTGTLLFSIDPRPFEIDLQQAQAQYQLAVQQMQGYQSNVDTAKAVLAQRQAEYENAKLDGARAIKLAKKGVLPRQTADDAQAKITTSLAAVNAAQAQLQQAQAQLGIVGDQNATVLKAKTAVDQANLNLSYTKVYATTNGRIENFTLRIGDVVSANSPLFAVIDESQWWVDANYKETDLARIRANQKVEIELDMYPGHRFHGVVDNVSAGSGSTFSLLPPENATGNWVKVVQRFPVKIKITDPTLKYPLRVGASATVTVDTSNL